MEEEEDDEEGEEDEEYEEVWSNVHMQRFIEILPILGWQQSQFESLV